MKGLARFKGWLFNKFNKRKKTPNKQDEVDEVSCSPSADKINSENRNALRPDVSAANDFLDLSYSTAAEELVSNDWPKVNCDLRHCRNDLSNEAFNRIESQMLWLNSDLFPLKETNINNLSANKNISEKAGKILNTTCVQHGHDTLTYAPHQNCSTETQQSDNIDCCSDFDGWRKANSDNSNSYAVRQLETELSFEKAAISSDESFTKEKILTQINHTRVDDKRGIDQVEEVLISDFCANQWQLQDVVTKNGGMFKTKHSDVCLTVKQNSVDINTTISGSILLDIPYLRSKFKLHESQIIVAPAVEYHLHEVSHLKLHACLELPHCMGSRNVHNMEVSWYETVRGKVTKHSIRQIECSAQEIPQNLDIFWMKGTRRNTINVFAKHFCVVLCTACEEDVEFDIRALLFHKFGNIHPLTLSLQLHLGGPLSKIKDFEQATIEKMKKKDMTLIEDADLNLVPRLDGTLRFHLELLEIGNGKWEHVRRENGGHVHASQQSIDVKRMAKCRNEHVINDGVKWWLKCVTVSTDACCFCTDVIHDAHASNAESETSATTTIHAELQVPEERQHNDVTQLKSIQDCPERGIIQRLMDRFQDISRSRKLFERFGIPFREERLTRDGEEFWQREFGTLLRSRGLDYFLSELGVFLQQHGEIELLKEIKDICCAKNTLPGSNTMYMPRRDSNLPFLQPDNDISIQGMST